MKKVHTFFIKIIYIRVNLFSSLLPWNMQRLTMEHIYFEQGVGLFGYNYSEPAKVILMANISH